MASPAAPPKGAIDSQRMSARVFPLSGDSKRVWRSIHHRKVLKTLEGAIQQGGGVLLLTGETGCGKTVLARALPDALAGTDVLVGWLPFPDLEPHDFYTVLAEVFPDYPVVGDDVLRAFRQFLGDAMARGQRVLLVIDEAQALRPELFREIVNLLEADRQANGDQTGVFNVLLVGQSHLETILGEPQHAALAALIRVRCALRPLTAKEVAGFTRYYLRAAGLDPNRFTPEAIEEIWTRSRGIPRMINLVCDQTLQKAVDSGAETVEAPFVTERVGEEIADERALAEQFFALAEAEPPRRWIRAGGVVLVGLTISAGLLVYHSWESFSRNLAPQATTVEQAPPRQDTIAPVADIRSPSPAATIQPAAVATTVPAKSLSLPPRAPARVKGGLSLTTTPEKPRRARPVAAVTSPPPAQEAAVVTAAPAATRTEEPDPRVVIDWLLKQGPSRPD